MHVGKHALGLTDPAGERQRKPEPPHGKCEVIELI